LKGRKGQDERKKAFRPFHIKQLRCLETSAPIT